MSQKKWPDVGIVISLDDDDDEQLRTTQTLEIAAQECRLRWSVVQASDVAVTRETILFRDCKVALVVVRVSGLTDARGVSETLRADFEKRRGAAPPLIAMVDDFDAADRDGLQRHFQAVVQRPLDRETALSLIVNFLLPKPPPSRVASVSAAAVEDAGVEYPLRHFFNAAASVQHEITKQKRSRKRERNKLKTADSCAEPLVTRLLLRGDAGGEPKIQRVDRSLASKLDYEQRDLRGLSLAEIILETRGGGEHALIDALLRGAPPQRALVVLKRKGGAPLGPHFVQAHALRRSAGKTLLLLSVTSCSKRALTFKLRHLVKPPEPAAPAAAAAGVAAPKATKAPPAKGSV
ncbi:hypothetical protein M885DRAFT_518787 [Pelagophyceae sp. CCMP2097]|nr:hypothetical protein M885DRAFT_518787 [Pelagophyceae sp. CCMP2097]